MEGSTAPGLGRRTLVKAGVSLGAIALGAPSIIKARGEEPVKIGMIDPLTGTLSALAQTEVEGAKYAVAVLNKKNGILGRQVELLVEDSANDVGTGVQKAHKLIDRDKVNVIFADVNSGIAYAVAQVTTQSKVLHIVPGGHTDPITGTNCKWNVFRVCNTTSMDATAITSTLIKKFGKKWYFITPDYAYGHTLQEGFVKQLKKAGGEYQADMLPISSTDFSATLIKARAYKPDVLLNNMGGLAQIDCMKQFIQFGMAKQMALGGALFELESIRSVPPEAQAGWWDMEWWWNQPNVPEAVNYVAEFRKANGKTPTARHWFGWVAVNSFKIAAEKAKSLEAIKMAHALEDEVLPPDIALQPGKIVFRAGDHQLMSNVFTGEVHPPKGGNPDDVFTVAQLVPGEQAAGTVADTGCKMTFPTA
ncbi:MAG TPA: ABC transporter substrate-binding protein [Acetobacteraceae bacterium]